MTQQFMWWCTYTNRNKCFKIYEIGEEKLKPSCNFPQKVVDDNSELEVILNFDFCVVKSYNKHHHHHQT